MADDTSHGWRVALVVAMIGAVASIIAAVIAQGGRDREENGTASSTPTFQEPASASTEPSSTSTTPSSSGTTPDPETDASQPSAGSTYLVDINPVDRDNVSIYDEPAVVDGVTYVHPVGTYHPKGQAFLEYDLGRKYSRFQATVGVSDDSDSATRKRLEVYGDGRILASVEVGLGVPQNIDIPISGVLRLKLVQITLNDGFANAYVIWGDAQLLRSN